MLAVTFGVVMWTGRSEQQPPPQADAEGVAIPAPEKPNAPPPADPHACSTVVAAMPLRDRLAQRLMVGLSLAQASTAKSLVTKSQVGAVFVNGHPTAQQLTGALKPMQDAAKQPVAVAVDDEGGRVQRVIAADGKMPSARVMAKTMTPAQVRAVAAKHGKELRARGVTIDLAPVLDVGTQPDDAVIGDRSFSPDPKKVVTYAGAFAAGLRDAGILPVFKHFPGHGRGTGDSHKGSVTTPPLSSLRTNDLTPYSQLLGSGPAAVLLGHLEVPGLTNGVPASLSPAAYKLLRDDYHFTGVAITDDLGAMKAITDSYTLPNAVLTALKAGADIALWTSSDTLTQVLDRLEKAVTDGQLTQRNVTESTVRILAAKGACTP